MREDGGRYGTSEMSSRNESNKNHREYYQQSTVIVNLAERRISKVLHLRDHSSFRIKCIKRLPMQDSPSN